MCNLAKAPKPIQTQPHLKIALFNTLFLNSNGQMFNEYVTNNNLDFRSIT